MNIRGTKGTFHAKTGSIKGRNGKDLTEAEDIKKRCQGEGNGNPFQYSCLEILMDRGAWWATAHGVTQSWTCLQTHAHTEQASPLHRKGSDRPSACVAGLLQRQLQQEEAGVLQTVSTHCAARPHQNTCWGPVHLGPK